MRITGLFLDSLSCLRINLGAAADASQGARELTIVEPSGKQTLLSSL